MNRAVREFVEIAQRTMQLQDPILEFGSFLVPEQTELANLRPIFPGKTFVGTDMRHGKGVDVLVNLHQAGIKSGSIGTVLCLETLEHVEYPHSALREIHRVLKNDGIVLIASPMKFPIHNYPNDYWRFTPSAFESLLKPFAGSWTGSLGEAHFPDTVLGMGFKARPPQLTMFEKEFAALKARLDKPYDSALRAILPPIVAHYLWRIRKRFRGES